MRMDQYSGLNEWARNTVQKREKARVTGTMTFEDGRQRKFTRWAKVPVARIQTIGAIHRFYGGSRLADLRRFTMPDGTVYEEYVQSTPWSGGPVYHTALKNAATGEPVVESLWTDEELANC